MWRTRKSDSVLHKTMYNLILNKKCETMLLKEKMQRVDKLLLL